MSAVEVRFENLSVDADVHVGGRALPTVLNSALNFVEVCFSAQGLCMTLSAAHAVVKRLQDFTVLVAPSPEATLLCK